MLLNKLCHCIKSRVDVNVLPELYCIHHTFLCFQLWSMSATAAAVWAVFLDVPQRRRDTSTLWKEHRLPRDADLALSVRRAVIADFQVKTCKHCKLPNCREEREDEQIASLQQCPLVLFVSLRAHICVCACFPAVLSFCHKELRIYYSERPHSIDAHTCLRQSVRQREQGG